MSDRVFEVFDKYTPVVQPVSIDEAFLDMTGCCGLHGSVQNTAVNLKKDIKRATQLTGSIGVAPSRMVAKIASDFQKPDGLTVVAPDLVQAFLDPLAVRKIWGIGTKTENILKKLGIHSVGQLRQYPVNILEKKLGSNGAWLHGLAQSKDLSEVENCEPMKSLSHETTFEKDTQDLDMVRNVILDLSTRVAARLRKHKVKGRTMHFVYRDSTFRRFVRSKTLDRPFDTDRVIFKTAENLFHSENWDGRKIRLVGVGVGNLDEGKGGQLCLFTGNNDKTEQKVMKAVDKVNEKWGRNSVIKATQIDIFRKA